MKELKKAVSSCLNKLADEIAKFSQSEFKDFLDGNFELEINVKNKAYKPKSIKKSELPDEKEIHEIEGTLRQMESREKGISFIQEKNLSKDGLILIAKHLDVPVQRRESIKRITEKIIETTIGYKLRSQAIQGSEKSYKNGITNKGLVPSRGTRARY